MVQNAVEMIDKERAWHDQHFPVQREEVKTAIETRCFFPFGRARDGSPVVYMRGGLYDNTVATPQQYVLAAAHTIEYALKQYPDQVNVTVVVHSSAVPGVKNATGADTNFIKLFIQVSKTLVLHSQPTHLSVYPFVCLLSTCAQRCSATTIRSG